MARIAYNPFLANHLTPKATVGQVYDGIDAYGSNAKFRYVQFLDAVTYIKGHVVTAANAAGTAVTNDRSGGSAVYVTRAAGVALRAMTENYYGYIQVTGRAVVQTDDGVAAGESLVAHTVDGECDTMAAGEEHLVFGFTLAADASDQGIAWLTGCPA